MVKDYLIIGIILVSVAYGSHLYLKNQAIQEMQEVYEAAILIERSRARQTELLLRDISEQDLERKNDKIKKLSADLGVAVGKLQHRTSRSSSDSSASGDSISCSGAQLYREDAEFLTREAFRAEGVLTERDYYYEQYEKARRALATHKGDAP